MTETISGDNVFRELEAQNRAVAQAFRTFRRHGEQLELTTRTETAIPEPTERATLAPRLYSTESAYGVEYRARRQLWSPVGAVVLLLIGLVTVAIVVGPALARFFVTHWQAILLPTAGLCVGAGTVLLVSRVGTSPLRAVAPPRADTEDPLQELKNLAERTASRLQSAYRMQLVAVLVVGAIFVTLIVWSVVMVSQNRILYASAFGSGSVAMVILTQWKWQPFDRINQARRLADNADTLATGLRLRMKTISEITDPSKRSKDSNQ